MSKETRCGRRPNPELSSSSSLVADAIQLRLRPQNQATPDDRRGGQRHLVQRVGTEQLEVRPGPDDERVAVYAIEPLGDVPRQLDVLSYGGGSSALAGDDPRQLTWLPAERTVLTVVRKGRAGFVSTIEVGGGELANTMTKVEFGSDVDEVRTVPIYGAGPGGRDKVVLVTGEDVEFFDVP